MREWRDVLDSDRSAEVVGLIDAAVAEDRVSPVSDHVRLRLRPDAPAAPESSRHLLVRDDDGRLAGYAHLEPGAEGSPAVAELVVHPELRRRGFGAELVAGLVELAPGPDALRVWSHGGHPGAARLAERHGFRQVRALWRMRREFDEPLPEASLPEGVRLRPFVVGRDEAAVVEVNNRAFSWHPEQGGWDVADVRAREAESWFDPAGFLLAVREDPDGGERLLGYHWTKVHAGEEPIGEVYVLGVDPDAQGGGLGKALTLAGLRHLRAAGLPAVMLYVESDNEPAIAVYRRLGFRHWDTDVQYARSSEQ
ncbi:mycothiol synthase [Streptoalloteichus tenebrarius]|uniref:mycothiol synthase n=1 Tax=Streptoalloteichus tenebrarius (strain ATCC 17920 / DSM 40477 / JCM 4838 / CBS 697.72 / NBRC 16177 / NCIMB 11028 / NRRL B-12390 / A12253. 1 / ISP 5477) TaxID=1933 RepID=UPI002646F92A|nr:mycothiol synthase [Streptoalloteichus tenebrarius]